MKYRLFLVSAFSPLICKGDYGISTNSSSSEHMTTLNSLSHAKDKTKEAQQQIFSTNEARYLRGLKPTTVKKARSDRMKAASVHSRKAKSAKTTKGSAKSSKKSKSSSKSKKNQEIGEINALTVFEALDQFENAEDALNGVSAQQLDIVVSAVQDLVLEKQLITPEATVQVYFDDPNFKADLFPARRRRHLLDMFDILPEGCETATDSIMTKALVIIFTFMGVNQTVLMAEGVSQNLLTLDSSNPLAFHLFRMSDMKWFDGDLDHALEGCMLIFSQLVHFFGVKELFRSLMSAIGIVTGGLDLLLMLIAIAVTNGSNIDPASSSLSSSLIDFLSAGKVWQESCFEPFGSCQRGVNCNDNNLCTIDRAICDSSTDWEWMCLNVPVECPAGYSCSPLDGRCNPDDLLVPCVAVIDEDSSFGGNQAAKWAEFRNEFPARPFCLLIPSNGSNMHIPERFLSDSLTIVHLDVVRDYGVASSAMDWVSMCGLDQYTPANVDWVGLFIDNSGSMSESNVAASRDLFKEKVEAMGLNIRKVVNGNENWIVPFLTTLIPEDPNDDDGCEKINGYIFHQNKDSALFDLTKEEGMGPKELAEICNNDARCNGFNTGGYLKSFIRSKLQWVDLNETNNSSSCIGLYQSESDSSEQEFGEKLIEIARAEIGVVEDIQGVSNKDQNGRIAQYIGAAYRTGDENRDFQNNPASIKPESYCVDFVSWVYREANLPIGPNGEGHYNTDQLINDMKQKHMWHKFGDGYNPVPGDIVIFKQSDRKETGTDHAGLFVSVEAYDQDGAIKKIKTVEGNTSDPNGSGPEGVYEKLRIDRDHGGWFYIVGFAHVFGDNNDVLFDPFLQRVMVHLDIISHPFQNCALGYLESAIQSTNYQTFVCEFRNKPAGCSDKMDLVTASREYSKLSASQNEALNKLQMTVRPSHWKQFLSYWRNESGSESCPAQKYSSIQLDLTDVMKFLDVTTNPFQKCAVEYLETTLDPETHGLFTCKYRNRSVTATCMEPLLGLMEAHDEFDDTLTYQIAALEFLQEEVQRTSLSEWYQFIFYWRRWGLPCDGGGPENAIVHGIPCQTSTEIGVCLYGSIEYGGREIQTGLCKEKSKKCCLGIPHERVMYGVNNQYCSRYSPLTLTEAKDNYGNSIQLVPVQKLDLTDPSYADVSLDKKDNHMTFQIACIFEVMAAAAKQNGVDLKITSAFRTYARQEEFYNCNDWMNCQPSCPTYNTVSKSCNIAAKAGKSPHGKGIALDLNFNPDGFQWLNQHALDYGFSNAEGQHLEKPENWHWVFEGKADDDFQSDFYKGEPCTAGMPDELKSGTCMNYRDCKEGVAIPSSKGCENKPDDVLCCIPFQGSYFLPPKSPLATPANQVNTLYDKLQAHCVKETDCTGAVFHDPCIGDTPGCVDGSNPVFGCQPSNQTCLDDLNWSCPSGEKACIDETDPVWMVDVPGITLSKEVYNEMFPAIKNTPRGDAFYPYLNHAIVQVVFNSDNAKQRCYKVAAFVAHHKVETDGLMHFTERISARLPNYDYGKWRGRGAIHLTGVPGQFNHYVTQAKMLKNDAIFNTPELLAFPSLGYLTGAIYILRQGSPTKCIHFMGYDDYDTFKNLTKCIQGGESHLQQRWENFEQLAGLLHCDEL